MGAQILSSKHHGFQERERRRQLAAEKARERQDVSMARGVGDASKAFRTSQCRAVWSACLLLKACNYLPSMGGNIRTKKNLLPKLSEKA